jgi:hypothetical protein
MLHREMEEKNPELSSNGENSGLRIPEIDRASISRNRVRLPPPHPQSSWSLVNV